MKDFYTEHELVVPNETKQEYRSRKRAKVLEVIKPICDAFEIYDYDYILNENQERLRIENTHIGCACNSIGATVNELIAYIFINHYAVNRNLGAYENETLEHLSRYWINKK